jgi:hypothetical protein
MVYVVIIKQLGQSFGIGTSELVNLAAFHDEGYQQMFVFAGLEVLILGGVMLAAFCQWRRRDAKALGGTIPKERV